MLSNFDPKNTPPKFNPFRDNLIEVMAKADSLSDAELKAKLAKLLEDKIEHYEVRRPTIVLKQVH